jgi:outer membrane protein OmpA-like peptidoglycan-associated protein
MLNVRAALAAAAVMMPALAGAQTTSGLYIAGAAGINHRDAINASGAQTLSRQVGSPALSAGPAYIDNRIGWAGVASVGYGIPLNLFGFSNGVRLEIEGSARGNDPEKIREFGRRLTNVGGTVTNYGGAFNVITEIGLGSVGGIPMTPYLGLGFGFGVVSYDKVNGTLAANGTRTQWDGQTKISDHYGLAYNMMLGNSFGLDSLLPGLSATVEWRYYTIINNAVRTTVSGPGGTISRLTVPNCCHDHSLLVGLRYAFGAPARVTPAAQAPAAAPAPAASVARTYLVFFDWDRADLTARAREIIREAATNAQRARVTRIEVAGHADRSGDAAYNQRLSQRRAEAVAAELVRDGVARNAITVQAFGESRPLVPTADNVREPQNRRVEIVLR